MRERTLLLRAVDDFAFEMKEKLMLKLNEGYHGWDDSSIEQKIIEKMKINFSAGDYIDVANLAMMLHRFKKEKP